MKLIWAEAAVSQLAAIHDYISRTSPLYADVMLRRLWARGGQLTQFPNAGRSVPEHQRPNIREVYESPYRLIYQVSDTTVEVLAVVHERRATPGPVPLP